MNNATFEIAKSIGRRFACNGGCGEFEYEGMYVYWDCENLESPKEAAIRFRTSRNDSSKLTTLIGEIIEELWIDYYEGDVVGETWKRMWYGDECLIEITNLEVE